MSMVKEALRTEETKTREGRTVTGIVNSIETLEGGGFLVRRPFPKASFSDFDPFLLLDEMGPMDVAPGEAKGAPDHPHRGFETVTYMLSGDMEHKDSSGHAGQLRSGDVQWMTAGAGVVHAEMPSAEFMRTGGRMHGFQLWVNLPQRDKMTKPRYQEIPSSRCLSGLRVSARTLNCPRACRARTTPPPWCPVAPITAISFLLLDNIFTTPYIRSFKS